MATLPLEHIENEETTVTVEPAKVILFNDDVHTFDEVISQVIKAIHCDHQTAESLVHEVHSNGKAVVYSGDVHQCVEVSGVLEEIMLMTQIEVL